MDLNWDRVSVIALCQLASAKHTHFSVLNHTDVFILMLKYKEYTLFIQFVLLKQSMLVEVLFACLITEVYSAQNLSAAVTK